MILLNGLFQNLVSFLTRILGMQSILNTTKSLSIPKQAFVAWLVMKDAWLIGRKLLNWVYKGEVKCVFCRYPMALCNVLNPHTLWDDIVDL